MSNHTTDVMRRLLRLYLALVFLSTALSGKEPDDRLYRSFYGLVDTIRADSAAQRIVALQQFLHRHPGFADVYFTLLDWYTFHEQFEAGKAYFQSLTKDSSCARNAYWMLAKTYQLEADEAGAFAAFLRAVGSSDPPVSLLYEFVEFDHYRSDKFRGEALLRNRALSVLSRRLAQAFYAYFRSEYKTVIDILSQLPPELIGQKIVLEVWGTACFYQSQTSRAEARWRQGYRLALAQHDLRAAAKFLTYCGFFAQQVNKEYAAALKHYDDAYALALQSMDYHRQQMLSGYRGYLYRDCGDYREAEKAFLEAIRVCARLNQPRFLADWYRGLGTTYYSLGRYTEGYDALSRAGTVAMASKNGYYIVSVLFDRADFYIKLKQLDLAEKDLQSAYQIAKSNQMRYEQETARAKQGQLLLEAQHFARARNAFEAYLRYLDQTPTYRKEAFEWLGKIAESYYQERSFEQAREYYLAAFDAATSVDAANYQGMCQLRLGNIALYQGHREEAVHYYDRAFRIASAENISDLLWEIFVGYGDLHRQSGDLQKAIRSYRQAAQVVEATRSRLHADPFRIGYFAETHTVYQKLVQCYLQRYQQENDAVDLDSIFVYHSLGQSRALLDLQHNAGHISYTEAYERTVAELRGQQRLLREASSHFPPPADLDSLQNRLETLRLTLLAQRLQLIRQDQKGGLPPQSTLPSLADIRDYLQRTQAGLLLYHIAEDNAFVMVITGSDNCIVPLKSASKMLAAGVDSLITPFHRIDQPDLRKQPVFRADIAYRLYQVLIEPVEKNIALPQQLLVLPDTPMMNLPLDMLLTAPAERPAYVPRDFPDYADKFLVHRYTITNCPTAAFLGKAEPQPLSGPAMTIFANPFTYDTTATAAAPEAAYANRAGWVFEPLVYADIEAKQIQKIYPEAKIIQQEQATKFALQQEISRCQIVHMATHGFADSTFAAFSGLALALSSDTADDGLLMGYEIMDLQLNCDLITLSACESGRGRLVAGEGILGLPRLFLGAGAKSVLMTHWQVSDRFTSELMPVFYRLLLREGLTKAAALSHAKRMMIRQHQNSETAIYYQHPFFWAPFTLYGHPGSNSDSWEKTWLKWRWALAILLLVICAILIRYYLRAKDAG